ncbi:MAG: amidohydrolase [Halobacteriales archaeon]|nr:amidohydrolase [Halobacteriales archaeon]
MPDPSPSDLLVRNGMIHLFDDDRTTVDAVLFRGDTVASVGENAIDTASADADVLDLDGRTVLPGFNDAHTHIFSVGIQLIESDLSDASNRAEALNALRENAETTPAGNWVLGFGYDESTWPEGERDYLAKAELDEISTDHPIAAHRVDGHSVSLNSVALERVDFDGVDHDVITDADGDPTGRAVEDAAGRVKIDSYPDPAKARRALSAAIDRYHELGTTSVQTVAGLTAIREHGSITQEALHRAWREDGLDLRITYYAHASQAESLSDLQLASSFGDEFLRIGGLKTFSDGSLGSRTAKIHGEYIDDPGNDGQMVHDGDQLEAWYREAARADQQIATHAIGGQAIDIVIDRYEAVLEDYDIDDPRLRVEHFELATDEAIERMAEHGFIASVQPNFLQWSMNDGLYEARLGEDALSANNRYADILEADVPLAFGSDKMPPGPLYGIDYAVNTPHDPQRLSVDEAIAAYTRGAAYAEFAEDEKGTLEPGMVADAVVLDRDPHDHPEAIADIDVEQTIVAGEVVYEAE